MRVCLVSREIRPFSGGGIATYIAESARALMAAGHEVTILTDPQPDLAARGGAMAPGAEFRTVDLERGAAAIPGAYAAHATRYAMGVYDTLKELHEERPFDAVEFPEYQGPGFFCLRGKRSLGQFKKCALIVRLHTPHYLTREIDGDWRLPREFAYIDALEKGSAREADALVSGSRAMLNRMLTDLGPLAREERAQPRAIIPLPLADLGGALAGQPAPSEPGYVLYFGRLQRHKGVAEFVEAAVHVLEEGLPGVRFRLVGSDTPSGPFGRSMLESLQRRIPARHRERIIFEPPLPREELPRVIAGARVVCIPSRWESYAYACVEAMSVGAAVLVSDAGALPEIVRDGVDGLVFPWGDAPAMAAGLRRLYEDEALRTRLGASAVERAQALADPGAYARSFESLVEAVRAAEPAAPAVHVQARPAVSVIIPHYNLGDYLPQTLASLDEQTFTDFETIIVDDGSTDPASCALLEKLEREGRRIIRKANGGLGSARNAGLRAARADCVLPLDADDLAHRTMIERLYTALQREPELAAVSPFFRSFETDPEQIASAYVPVGLDETLLLVENVAGPGGGSMLRREVALEIGGYDEELTSYEDWELWLRMRRLGLRTAVVPEFLLYYRLRPGSLIRSEVAVRRQALESFLLRRHGNGADNPEAALRLLLADRWTWQAEAARWEEAARSWQAEAERYQALADAARAHAPDHATIHRLVEETVSENVRYRLADHANEALKRLKIQTLVKTVALRARGVGGRSRSTS